VDRQINSQITTADGVRISYNVEGPEGAPWIVLSNSLATDRHVWDPQIAALTATRQVLRYDSRGHGLSDAGTSPYNFDQLADDVIALMDHLDVKIADFMGISLGGMTGLAVALKHPTRIQRLVCCDARADAPDAYKNIWDVNIARLQASKLEALCAPTMERWFTPAFLVSDQNAEVLSAVRSMINATSATGYEGVGRCLQSLDFLGDLPKISCPTLYVTGEFDLAAPVAVMQNMTEITPNAKFEVVKSAAHLSNIEQPDRFLNAIKDFLAL